MCGREDGWVVCVVGLVMLFAVGVNEGGRVVSVAYSESCEAVCLSTPIESET